MTEVIAVFDLEGTLCRGGSFLWREMLKWQLQHSHRIGRVVAHVVYSVPTGLLYRVRLTNGRGARLGIIKDLAPLLKGLSEEDLKQLAELISERMFARLRPDIQTILEDHKRRGHSVVLVSSIFQPILEAIGLRLGMDLSIGTELEKRGSYYSGQVVSPICFNEQRALLLRKRLGETGLEVELSRSYAYGDTIWDRPVLQMVGNPVAVYPDPELRAYAQEQGWRIIK